MRQLLLAGLLLATAALAEAQNANPIIGSWKLNPEKSQFPTKQHTQMEIRQYRERSDGYLVGLAIFVDASGSPGFSQFTVKSDGNFYPEYNADAISELSVNGYATPLAYAEKFTGERLIDWTDKRNGTVVSSGTTQISDDGKQLFIIVNNPGHHGQPSTYTLVYDRQ
ncbi:MAG TPA: hypothetical protein VMH83_11540 [Candidatus Acidoferrum sp.]|nr:hypothetical protein [Candidatus Acidoferrum sp.]